MRTYASTKEKSLSLSKNMHKCTNDQRSSQSNSIVKLKYPGVSFHKAKLFSLACAVYANYDYMLHTKRIINGVRK